MLKIGGFEKISLIDYSGKISAIVFLHGCNLRCPYCHNPELVIEKFIDTGLSEEYILEFLKRRKGKLDAVVITGGEPLLQEGLETFIKKIKDLGYFVKLDTNGLLPEKLSVLMKKGLLDYISMDVKYPTAQYLSFAGKDSLENIQKSIKIIMNGDVDYEFRTTYVKGIHNVDDTKLIGEMIKGSKRYFIQNFRSGKTIDNSLSFNNSFTEKELSSIKKKITPYVKEVVIR